MRAQGFDQIEPTEMAEAGWMQHVGRCRIDNAFPTGELVVCGRQHTGHYRHSEIALFGPAPRVRDLRCAVTREI